MKESHPLTRETVDDNRVKIKDQEKKLRLAEAISEFIDKCYSLEISHYRREHASNRRSPSEEYSIAKIHQAFVHSNETFFNCSYESFRKIFKDLKITITKLGHEECEICEMHKIHITDLSLLENHEDNKCESYLKYSKNKGLVKKARELYEKHSAMANSHESCACYVDEKTDEVNESEAGRQRMSAYLLCYFLSLNNN